MLFFFLVSYGQAEKFKPFSSSQTVLQLATRYRMVLQHLPRVTEGWQLRDGSAVAHEAAACSHLGLSQGARSGCGRCHLPSSAASRRCSERCPWCSPLRVPCLRCRKCSGCSGRGWQRLLLPGGDGDEERGAGCEPHDVVTASRAASGPAPALRSWRRRCSLPAAYCSLRVFFFKRF